MQSDSGERIVEVLPGALAGERLDRVVSLIGDVSRSDARKIIESGGVELDGTVANSGKLRLAEGQIVSVDPATFPVEQPPQADDDVQFDVLYDDEDVIVVDKPAGLVVHPGAGNPTGTLVNGLLARYPDIYGVGDIQRPGIVHRLDAGSSGLLVVARNPAALENLAAQFKQHSARRIYLALVWGHPNATHAIIDAPIGRSKRDPLRMAVVAAGRPARTEYTVLQTFASPTELALVECRLETGRTHQIRVHLSSINHPLVGDPVYGQRRPKLQVERPFLHATRLAFEHPASGDSVTFESDLASDLEERLRTLS